MQTAGSKDVDETFPEALKEPVLRRVQFQTISRVDNLGTLWWSPKVFMSDGLLTFRVPIVDHLFEVSPIPTSVILTGVF